MYCLISDVSSLLPSSISIGDQNLGTPSPGRPETKRSSLTPDRVTFFIRKAQEEIDSRLRPYYVTPLRRIKITETPILNNLNAGTNVNVKMYDTSVWSKGETVEVRTNDIIETTTISSVTDTENLVLTSLANSFLHADGALISLLEFPDPIPLITARLAVSIAFDTLFVSDQEPNVSTYGNSQRQLAFNDLDSVLDGTIKLYGQEHTGRRFIRGSLFDAYKNPVKDFSFGREKPSSGGG